MENKDISKTTQKRTPSPIDLDDIDFDKLTFKPITQGLGFHPEKKEIPIIRSKMSTPRPSINLQKPLVSPPLMTQVPRATPQKAKVEEKILEEAQLSFRLMAFTLDLLIILLASGFTFFLMALGSGLSFEILASIFSLQEIILFTTGVFSIYFLFYFSILDLSSTVGKSFMGLEVKTMEGKKPVIQNTFFRSILTLAFLPLLGTPVIGEAQDKLSGTKIFKR